MAGRLGRRDVGFVHLGVSRFGLAANWMYGYPMFL